MATNREMVETIAEHDKERRRLRAEIYEWEKFVAASSLCEGCSENRMSRAIIATPRQKVEERVESQAAVIRSLCAAMKEMSENISTVLYNIGEPYNGR